MNGSLSSPNDESTSCATPVDPLVLTWSVHPARDRPWATALTLVVIVAFAMGASQMMQQIRWGIFSGGALFFSLRRFFFATEVEANSHQITVSGLLGKGQLAWSQVRRFEIHGRSLSLSTRVRPSFLDYFRCFDAPLPKEAAIPVQLKTWWQHATSTRPTAEPSTGKNPPC